MNSGKAEMPILSQVNSGIMNYWKVQRLKGETNNNPLLASEYLAELFCRYGHYPYLCNMKRWNIPISKDTLVVMQQQGLTQSQMAKILMVSTDTIERRIKKYGLQGYSSVRYDLMNVQDPVFCYLLGWFCTDGYLTKGNRVALRIYEQEVIKALTDYFQCKMYTIPSRGKTKECYELYFAWAPAIFKECASQSKTTDVIVPNIPFENIDMFLRGVIEGDGCIRPVKQSKSTLIRIFTNSERFAFMLQSIVATHNYRVRIRPDRMGWELSTGDLNLLQFTYNRHLEFVCNRKYERVKQWLSI